MKSLRTRYGATLSITVSVDDDDATEATIIIGNPQEVPIFTKTVTLVNGEGDLSLDPGETRLPLGTYKYQINIEYSNGDVKKFPEPKNCDTSDFPDFQVLEALDEEEVSS